VAASIDFYAGNVTLVPANTGLGFFGPAGFGALLPVGQYNSRTYVSDETGAVAGAEAWNAKHASPTGVVVGPTGTPIPLSHLPNVQATVNIRGTFDGPVSVASATLFVYDGVGDVTTGTPPAATGLDVAVYEVSHLNPSQVAGGSGGPGTPLVSGQHAWKYFSSGVSASGMPLTTSPGVSGTRPSGAGTVSARHDWYLAASVKPVSAGNKQAAFFMTCDYA
jgi:hypothetical protein